MMADAVITHTADYIKIVANDAASELHYHTKYYERTELRSVELSEDQCCVLIEMRDKHEYVLTWDGTKGTKVDSVQTVIPSSNANLASLLSNCMAI